ncbi:AraC family transcriptional regulator [Kutzneria buriramensis]|uniref:AraC-like DNA-binding protein n=2 Tax=Kutzneria buriramensis TaxID=1045776 RepID=A0A3E0GZH7_9PSEU|nr:AraC family transcriptional regulator [Kutzneria buriramensis]REH35745.1 AraC-like DNA-binding protein [Kutzneria buriramensis]
MLSDVITVMRAGQPRSARVTWHAPWGQRFEPVPGASGFQVVLQGSCWLLPTSADPIPLAAGDVVFLPHGRGHALADSPMTPLSAQACDPNDPRFLQRHAATVDRVNGGPVTITLCGAYQLDPTRAHPLLLSLPEIIHLPAGPGQHPRLRAAVELLGAELEQPGLGADAAIPSLLDTLLVYILRTWIQPQPDNNPGGWAAALNDPPVTAALHAIHRDTAHPWTVASLAAQAGLSRAPFARRFTTLVGQPPLTYLTWWRMTTAARLLRDTGAPLNAVAVKVGYSSEFAFAAAFKRAHGSPPGQYRRAAHTQRQPGSTQ